TEIGASSTNFTSSLRRELLITLYATKNKSPIAKRQGFYCSSTHLTMSLGDGSNLSRNDAYVLTTKCTFNFELNATICFRKQGVVFTTTNVRASVEFSTTLTNNNAARRDQLTTESFNTKTFSF